MARDFFIPTKRQYVTKTIKREHFDANGNKTGETVETIREPEVSSNRPQQSSGSVAGSFLGVALGGALMGSIFGS